MAERLPNMGKIQFLMGNLIFPTQKSFFKDWDKKNNHLWTLKMLSYLHSTIGCTKIKDWATIRNSGSQYPLHAF